MWPGANSPAGPAPAGPAPSPGFAPPAGPGPAGPSAGWYALPVALVVLAAGLLTVAALVRDDSGAARGPSATGDAVSGLPVRLSAGHTYFLYVRRDGSSPFGCAVALGAEHGRVRLTRKNSSRAADRPGYRYTASMTAPVTGTAVLTCRGTDGPLLVTPDAGARCYAGAASSAALGLGAAVAAVFGLTLASRRRARRRARARAAGGNSRTGRLATGLPPH
ncbi:hypothetical protein [Actinomadura opuntiae]|uniref:hypothetical protein n=1 Tax=Actinomadura sp. OS1-43 TaxID=604315 RepID=UPI00255B2DF7|nr:hypothetical protein [Actinomadura sp. OS1-43]MDL4821572.1 hypothetical protein [Actinomadura sp. OS1-43]